VLGALGLGAALILIGGALRSSVSNVSGWRARRRDRKRQALLRVREQGHRWLWSGDLDAATRTLARYVEQHPRDVDAVLALANTYEERGELETARRMLESARGEVGSEARILHQLGRLALKRGNAGAAIDWLREAVQQHPESPRLLGELAAALAAEGRFAEAVPIAQRQVAAERQPGKRDEAIRHLVALRFRAAEADVNVAAGDHALRRLLAEAPDFLPTVLLLASRARANNDVRGAERLYRDAIRRHPRGVLLERLAALHAAAGQADRALPILRDACAGNKLAGPRLALARALVQAGKHPAADAELGELVRDTPTWRTDGIDVAPERDLVAGELALARGHDREAATLLGRAATGSHRAFSYACPRCAQVWAEWRDQCRCGAYGTLEWTVDLPTTARERAGNAEPVTALGA
jgi:tetratricopeptide (TPR) repeat protein